MKLTRTEIHWLINLVAHEKQESADLRDMETAADTSRAFGALRYENMAALENTLQSILDTDAKRVTIG